MHYNTNLLFYFGAKWRLMSVLVCSLFFAGLFCKDCSAKITDIDAFLEVCPTDDPIFEKLTMDFVLMKNGVWVDPGELECTSPISTLPIEQWTDELIFYQALRTIYYMDFGQAGHLPWTALSLYDWMRKGVDGAQLNDGISGGACCTLIEGKTLFWGGTEQESGRDFRRKWNGIAAKIFFYAHERRHADANAPSHTITDCCESSPGCDQDYDESNLGAYGVAHSLLKQIATREIDLGGCGDLFERLNTMALYGDAQGKNICTNPPDPIVINSNGPECGAGVFNGRGALTGLWYDPALDGEGFNFIVSDSQLVIVFYGYSLNGERIWLFSEPFAGEIQAVKTLVIKVFEFIGGTFDLPEPSQSARLPWGTVTIQFDDCSEGLVQLSGIDGEKLSAIMPLITAGGVECTKESANQ